MGIDLGDIKVSKICTDGRGDSWWAVGTKKQYLELRITKGGKIMPFKVTKGKHPYFTK
jgi:hypothetical protein